MTDYEYFRRVSELFGGWPDRYLVFDLETQGKIPHDITTLPVEFGWCEVAQGRLLASGSEMLDWGRGEHGVDPMWFYESIEKTGRAMRERGSNYRFTPDLVRSMGKPPADVLRRAAGILAEARVEGWPIVGFNHQNFDRPILENAFRRTGVGFAPMTDDEMIDAMAVHRGCVSREPPCNGETRQQWAGKLLKRYVKGTLSDCAEIYRVGAVDVEDTHTGMGDSITTHRLIEAFRRISAGAYDGGT